MPSWLEQFVNALPHGHALGLELVSSDSERGHAALRLPWREDLVGDPATDVLHGGVITTLLDTLGGCCVLARNLRLQATLDLRIDYLRPATPRVDLIGEAECYRVTRNVAFVRGSCHHGDPGRPVANLTATFMLKGPKP